MAAATRKEKLIEVKLALAKKYDHLSKVRKSKISQAKHQRRAAGYRHEAAVLSRS